MDKLLSICIPTFNRAQYLILALDSILPQITSDIEIVISDNGSTDKTIACIEAYKQKFASIKTCGFSSNQGIDRNIENCFLNASGDYVFLFSDDDLLMPNSLQRVVECLKSKEPSVICLNHFSFKNHSLAYKLPPFLANKLLCFESGKAFFKYCGLGFLSSLIVDRYEALKHLPSIKKGRECAHLDVVARVALTGHGPFIFLGTTHIAARSLDPPRYIPLKSCIIYQKSFYEDLLDERLLDMESFHFFIKRLMYKDLIRILFKSFKTHGSLNLEDLELLLKKGFDEYIGFKLIIKPLFYLNNKTLNLLYKLLLHLAKAHRKIKTLLSS